MNGARLAQIHQDYVVLERKGRSERLYIEGSKQSSKNDSDLLMVGGPQEIKPVVATSTEVLTSGSALVADIDRKGKTERVTLDGALITADQQKPKSPPASAPMPFAPAAM